MMHGGHVRAGAAGVWWLTLKSLGEKGFTLAGCSNNTRRHREEEDVVSLEEASQARTEGGREAGCLALCCLVSGEVLALTRKSRLPLGPSSSCTPWYPPDPSMGACMDGITIIISQA